MHRYKERQASNGVTLRKALRARILIPACAAAAIMGGGGIASAQQTAATAEVRDASGRVVGSATFRPATDGVQVSARFQGVPPGRHGMHIHTEGRCEGPDFMTAGAHFNPTGHQHGLLNPAGAHAGDLPNLEVAADGTGSLTAIFHEATLAPGGPASLFKPGGTSLVIHANEDDEVTDPSGNSGGRIACGVVVAGAQAAPAQVPAALPRTGALPAGAEWIATVGVALAAAGLVLRGRAGR